MAEEKGKVVETDIRALIAEIVEIEEDKVAPEAKFIEDLGMDSMMALEIMASIEKKYKLKIPEESLVKMTNLRQVVSLVRELSK